MSGNSQNGGFLSSFRRMFGGGKRDRRVAEEELVLEPTMQSGPSSIDPLTTEADKELVLMAPRAAGKAAPSHPIGDPGDAGANDGTGDEIVSRAGTIFETDADPATFADDRSVPDHAEAEAGAMDARAAEKRDDAMISALMEMIDQSPDGAEPERHGEAAQASASEGDADGRTPDRSAADTSEASDELAGSESIRAFLADINEGARDASSSATSIGVVSERAEKSRDAEGSNERTIGPDTKAPDRKALDTDADDESGERLDHGGPAPADTTQADPPSTHAGRRSVASSVDAAMDAVAASLSASDGASGGDAGRTTKEPDPAVDDAPPQEPLAAQVGDQKGNDAEIDPAEEDPALFVAEDPSIVNLPNLDFDEGASADEAEDPGAEAVPMTFSADDPNDQVSDAASVGDREFNEVLESAMGEVLRESKATAVVAGKVVSATADEEELEDVQQPDDAQEIVDTEDIDNVVDLDDAEDAETDVPALPVMGSDELEETIRRVIREELQTGELGDNLSRNIVRMINEAVDAKLGNG